MCTECQFGRVIGRDNKQQQQKIYIYTKMNWRHNDNKNDNGFSREKNEKEHLGVFQEINYD